MGWNPFDDGDTERDGVNAHRPKESKNNGWKSPGVTKTMKDKTKTIQDILRGIN
jgi:hypothetical protein